MSEAFSHAPHANAAADAWSPEVAPPERHPRVWPGAIILVILLGLVFVPGMVLVPSMAQFMLRMWGPIACTLVLMLTWLFFSRVPWLDRFLVLGVFVGGAVAAWFTVDPSFQFGLILYVLPVATSAWILWLLCTPFLSWSPRRIGLLAVVMGCWAAALLFRMDGVDGNFSAELSLRWSQTAEQKFLAEHGPRMLVAHNITDHAPFESQPGDWPGFRGAERDGRLTGVRIGTDWAKTPPRQVWRHLVGPGWSSFAVVGGRLFTQEQRGTVEAVVCYDAATGEEVWVHEDETRFEETMSGAGPRATPTFHEGKIYTLGGKGRLNCLAASDGQVIWERDAAADAGAPMPTWGFASSPLVRQGVVMVFTGAEGKSLSGYDAVTGSPLWMAGDGNHGYCSPQPARLRGIDQVLIATNAGMSGLDPKEGKVLWHHEWKTDGPAPRCVQPALAGDDRVLLATAMGNGERLLRIDRKDDGWADPAEVWTSRALNAYFNDRVIHKGHIYGFDGNMFTCLNVDDGKARWRGGRYGNGQVLLLADQDLLLVLSEKGDVVLVAADPDKHRELGRFHAIDGKCWNHPVVAHGKLYVRNGEEAACYELPGAGDGGGVR